MRRFLISLICLIAVAAVAAAPMPAANQTRPAAGTSKDASLFDRLGGMPGVTALVDDFVNRVGADARINSFFAKADMTRLRKQLTDQLCQLAGGPCTYTGGDMLTVHKGMGIAGADFQAMMEDLIAALRHAKVSSGDEGALVGRLLPLKPDIVERP